MIVSNPIIYTIVLSPDSRRSISDRLDWENDEFEEVDQTAEEFLVIYYATSLIL
jgi:hypothetical protein